MGPLPLPQCFAWLLHQSTIIFFFFNEALESVYIVINKAITVVMAFCLSHLENWMQNLFNSPIMVSWSVTDLYNDSCNISAIIYCESWTLWPFTWVLVCLQLSWVHAAVALRRCMHAGFCAGVSATGCLGLEREATSASLLMTGVCLVQLCFHVGGFRESSFFGKMEILFWELQVTAQFESII